MRKPAIEEDNCRRSVFIITQPVSEQQAWTLREFLHRLSCCNCLYVVSKIQGEMDKNHTNRPRTILSILAKLVAQFLLGCCGIGACPGSMVRRLASPHNKKCVSWHILPKNPWSASNDIPMLICSFATALGWSCHISHRARSSRASLKDEAQSGLSQQSLIF
jgi:hypothetical protein